MTWLLIAGGITLLFAWLLFCPVSLEARYEEQLTARVGFLFFHYTVLPVKKDETEKREEKEEKQKKPSKLKELLQQNGLSGFVQLLRALSRAAYGSLKKVLSHTVVQLFDLSMTVGGEDAAQTAIRYGEVCGAVFSALSVLFSKVKWKRREIHIAPDFQEGKNTVLFHIRVKIKLFFLISAALSAILSFIKAYLKLKKESGHSDQKEKAVF